MSKVTSSQSNLTTGEISEKALGRYDLVKYNNGVKRMENWLINQLGGAFYRPGTRYVAETIDSTKKSRVIPFQYSADQDYVVEVGDLYMRFFENDADIINLGTSSKTKFLSNFNGVDASFNIQDSGNTGHVVTGVNGANTSTTQKKIGSASLSFNGTTQYITIPDHANFDFPNDYTIEMWIFTGNITADVVNRRIYSHGDNASAGSIDIYILPATGAINVGIDANGVAITGTTNIGDSAWHHIALSRNGNNTKLFVDGVQEGATFVGAEDLTHADDLWIGAYSPSGDGRFSGYMDEIRVSKGIARYTIPFTPILTPFTSDGTTQLLLHGESLDIAGYRPLTFVGNAEIDTAQKVFGSASLRLDGTGDYVSAPNSTDFDITTGDYTISGFFRIDDLPGNGVKQTLASQYASATSYWELGILNTAGTYSIYFNWYSGGSARSVTVDFVALLADTWYHLAMSKDGSDFYFWQDGVQVGTTQTNTNSVLAVNAILEIGCYNGTNNPYDGWIDDLRFDKGLARYTTAFTIPAVEGTVETITSTTLTTTYLEADLFDLHYAQSNDVMYIVHPNYPPRKLSRTDATTFSIADVAFVRGPFLDTNISATTITASADTGAGITLTASVGIFDASHVGSLWRVDDGVVKITAFTSVTVVTGDVQAEPDGSAGDLNNSAAPSTDWAEGAFSEYRGYPATVTFHEQRLVYANTTHEPQKFWGSVIQAYDNFDVGTAADDDAYSYEVATDQRNAIQWMVSSKTSLTIGTNGGTFSAGTGSVSEPITPTNVLVQRDTNYGVTNLMPQKISSFLYYIQRDLNKLRELKYSFESDSQISNDMTLLAEHILIDGSGCVDIAHQQSPNDRIWCVRSDGEIAVITRNPEQDVMGWARFIAGKDEKGDGTFESVCVIPKQYENDQIWVITRRYINGSYRRFVEYFTAEYFVEDWDAIQVDCSLTYDTHKDITGISNANPGIITCTAHGFSTGDQVKINGVNSILAGVEGSMVDGEYLLVEGGDADHFTLTTLLGVAVDTTLLGTYISGGEVRKMVTNISGLTHLIGATVSVQTDGYIPTTETYVVSAGGTITLSEKAAVAHVGLPYTGYLQLLKLSDGNPTGTGQTQTRRVYKGKLRLYRTQGLNIGRTLTTLDPLNYNEETDPEALFTGDMEKVFQTSWGREDEIIIEANKPLPAQILAIIQESEVN